MNIIIPLGGKGLRFKDEGFSLPKPLIKVQNKEIIFHLIDRLNLTAKDKIFIIYNRELDEFNFNKIVKGKYDNICMYKLEKETSGASETLMIGLKYFLDNSLIDNKPSICIDSDAFYVCDIIQIYKDNHLNEDGIIFYTDNDTKEAVYSYINLDDSNRVIQIEEKNKISENINTGCYCFSDLLFLLKYCEIILNEKVYMKNEPYISCIIKKMIDDGKNFKGIYVNPNEFVSLGTPKQVKKYENNIHSFLFDLDGTLVNTDEIYFDVWLGILKQYNIHLEMDMFQKYIQGNSDLYVLKNLLTNLNLSLNELSRLKDKLFLENIHKIKLIDGSIQFIEKVKNYGHHIGIVTNCNRMVAENILNHTGINKFIDLLVIGNELKYTKPHPEPYIEACKLLKTNYDRVLIFEDSKSGLLSGKNIYPKALIAVRNLYSESTYKDLNVNMIIDNFLNLKVDNVLKINNMEKNNLIDIIHQNAQIIFQDEKIFKILLDESKLKGGYISDVISLQIITNLNTYHCVIKLENRNPSFLSKMANDLGLYEREYYFYQNLSRFVPINFPKFYGILKDKNDSKIGILLENLFHKKFVPGLDLNKNPIDNILLIVDSCAKLHSKFWNKECQSIFPQLKKHNDILFKPKWKNFIQEKYPYFKERWNFLKNSFFYKLGDWIVENFDKIQDYLSCKNLTLCHGDVKSLNIFYELTKKNLYEPHFIDWQYINNGKGVQDIVFFMIESFDISSISDIHNIIKDYYFIKCQEYGVTNYHLEEYNKDFVYSILYFPFFVAIWFGTLPLDDLIDKNFPYFFIQKLNNFFNLYENLIKIYID